MNNIEIFEYEGNFYVIKTDDVEPRESFIERAWYIIKRLNKDTSNINELIVQSKIVDNERVFKCTYGK
jgi:hypothetical protein